MTQHFRAQFQTADGRTHAVVDDQPITVERLRLAVALYGADHPLGMLIDLSCVPSELLDAASAHVGTDARS